MDSNVMKVLYVVGWSFVIASWIAPYVMKKRNGKLSANGSPYVMGMILAAIGCGVFVAGLVINLMK